MKVSELIWHGARLSPVDLTLTIDEIAIELETGVIEDKVDSTSALILESFHCLPQEGKIVVKNILLCPRELLSICSL